MSDDVRTPATQLEIADLSNALKGVPVASLTVRKMAFELDLLRTMRAKEPAPFRGEDGAWRQFIYHLAREHLPFGAINKLVEMVRLSSVRGDGRVTQVYTDGDAFVWAAGTVEQMVSMNLWDEFNAHYKPEIQPRCVTCGWPLKESREKGCVAGDCSQRNPK